MAQRYKLTSDLIKTLEIPAKGNRVYYDTEVKGFGCRITSAGANSFVLNYRIGGRERRYTIGRVGHWTASAAREEANKLKRRIDSGEDVLELERAERAESTVKDVLDRYCRQHVDKLKSGKTVRRYFERDVIPVMGSRRLKQVRRAEIIQLVETKANDTPRAAALLLTHIKGLFSWAEDRELIEVNPAAGIKPAKVNKAMKPRQRARVLDDDEIKTLWSGAETCFHTLTALVLKLVLVTGQRPGEVAGMRWSEIDVKVWTIPGARRLKTETEQRVPLTETALDLIGQAKAEVERLSDRRKWKAGDEVFAARRNGGITVHGLDRAVSRYRAELGNKQQADWGHWTPHDLRRTCRTGLSACGVSEEIAERVIGHGHKGIVATYNHHRYDSEKRAALEAWERRLLRIIGQREPEDNVVPLARR
jgi:integrase